MRRILLATVFIMAVGGITGCGSSSSSECSCGICINDVPAYPCDSDESCGNFAVDQGCSSWQLVSDPSDTCGGEPQPVCQVSGCSGQCQCPGEPTADIADEPS